MIPIDGFTKDILMHGLSRIIVEDVDEIDNSTLAEIFKNYVDSFKEKLKNAGSSKLSRNDKESYTKTYQKWFNINPPEEYVSLMLDIIEKTINLLEDNKIDAKKSLETINVGKNSVNFGIPYNESYAILPAIIKQVEYYEFLSEFLTPTTGKKSMINLDPIWFSILAVGFLTCFAGYYGGKYYLMLKNDIERYYLAIKCGLEEEKYELLDILEDLEILTDINIQRRFSLEVEEVYELLLSMELAKKKASGRIFPITLYVIELSGNVYLAKNVIELDLRNSLEFMKKYIDRIKNYFMFDTSDAKAPLEELLNLALSELKNPVNEDNENLAYIMVKDLYRAINSGKVEILENTLYLLLRKGHSIMSSKSKSKSKLNLEKIFKNFAKEGNVISILEGML
ncbi:CRISPR-associated protein (provisional), Csx9 family [Methanocaldococcus sp. FS406-22]|uniref:type I-A CRISPR-associated protein Cas8a2/Csx9 n=1 Tax=Methanocaldococcus sp. (strain FS406-22) TaxID=644281 RepID=UPI0001BF2F9A|nr:type I-A CRISPR-associated protein Cas8a2/Csx9 [Methanocaldococcus sp. FS406-22]ADC69853.1 CRISPR-associated protein (provisional), Csx9 family [Methanocaldococcus sp. FS406-22]